MLFLEGTGYGGKQVTDRTHNIGQHERSRTKHESNKFILSQCMKIFGIVFDCGMKWTTHIDTLVKKQTK